MANNNVKPLKKIGTTTDDGESGADYFELAKIEIGKVDTDFYLDLEKKADAETYIENQLPATRCGHSYDCCGHRYENKARIIGDNGSDWVIIQCWYINI